ANFLGYFVRRNILRTTLEKLPSVAPLVKEYRKLEAEIEMPTRAPGVAPGDVRDHPLFVRGDHKQPGDPVPRRFLEAFGGREYPKDADGRLQFAQDIVADGNPLTPRVIVNRVFHHVFGRGIVSTPDNLGRLGSLPTHPLLLDALASDFTTKLSWSLKKLVRHLVTSQTFRQGSTPSVAAREKDPSNELLSHMSMRRLEAEAIRDSLLAVSGRLDSRMYGPSDGGGTRRSVYRRAKRNSLDSLLVVFDSPEPHTTVGARAVTNVPAQSLALLNSGFVAETATSWAQRVLAEDELKTDRQRVADMMLTAFGREATDAEIDDLVGYIAGSAQRAEELRTKLASLRAEVSKRKERIESIVAPARKKLIAEKDKNKKPVDLKPLARWDFDKGVDADVGDLRGKIHGNAKVEGGRLILDGESWVTSASFLDGITTKTIEAWVAVDGLDQRGVGIASVQTMKGEVFDSIVLGERRGRRWMAGSDNFERTEDANGYDESRSGEFVHVAITYEKDGTIRVYRDGKPYGKSFKKSGLVRYRPGRFQMAIGVRHTPDGEAEGLLRGSIDRVALYNRALKPEEIAASAGGSSSVSLDAVLASLSDTERAERVRLLGEVAEFEQQIARFPKEESGGPEKAWRELARTLFTFKEFIYLR
ncbi:MAG: DUF1553 domain-containing protein, partial [Planctomycetota bacterium]